MSAKDSIKNVRYKLCMSQKEFGNLVGLTATSICLYERGEANPGMRSIRNIVEKLKTQGIEMKYSDFMDNI